MSSKSDLHIHFHEPVGQGASIHVHVPSVGGIVEMLTRLREELLSKQALTTELSDAIRILLTKVQAADDVVQDAPTPNPSSAA